MARQNLLPILLSVCAAVFALTIDTYSQAIQSRQNAAAKESVKWQVMECQGINNCTSWTFVNTKGYAKWPTTGEEAVLEVVSLKDGTIVISRSDATGAKRGLTATYRGTLHDRNRVGGEYESVYQGQQDSGDWYWLVESNPLSLPPIMHMCIRCDEGLGGTLVLEDGHYRVVNPGPGGTSILTVEKFTRDSVIFHRTDSGRFPSTAVLTGKLSMDGNSIVNGIQTFPDGTSHTFRAAWGSAINTVLGSRGPDPVVSSPQITLSDIAAGIHVFHEAIDIFSFLAVFF
jgi:hypothetical protein